MYCNGPTIYCVQEKNHHLCCVFFPNSTKSPQSACWLLSVSSYLSYDGLVGSASAYQSVESVFAFHLRLIFSQGGKFPGV